jgi:hypothetical protein
LCLVTFQEEEPQRYRHRVKAGQPVEPNAYFPLSYIYIASYLQLLFCVISVKKLYLISHFLFIGDNLEDIRRCRVENIRIRSNVFEQSVDMFITSHPTKYHIPSSS